MSRSCGCFRFWLDDDETPAADLLERLAAAEHLRLCPDCHEEMTGIVAQRTALRAAYPASDVAPLVESRVRRIVDAMMRAALTEEALAAPEAEASAAEAEGDEASEGQSTG